MVSKNFSKLPVFLLLVAIHFCNSLLAQTNQPGKLQIFAPNTFELARYGDIPVDHSTGIPSIGVPLISLTDKDVTLDISLSYNAGGIKVDQEATWVGLGWALNCGGVITREIRGTPDGFGMDYRPRTSIPEYQSGQNMDNYADHVVYGPLQGAVAGATDNGADIFYFNFNGRSGKFFLDNDGKPVFTKYEDMTVVFEQAVPNTVRSRFVITDERGVKYEFNNEEFTQYYVIAGGNRITSAWYLSKITSPSGASITIEYIDGGLATKLFTKRCYDEIYYELRQNVSDHPVPMDYRIPCVRTEATIEGIVPRKITTSAGHYVELITATTRRLDADLDAPRNQLTAVILKNSQHEQIKRYNFTYGYFEPNSNRRLVLTNPATDARNILNYRMRLDAVQEVSSTGVLHAPYTFAYHGDNDPTTDDELTLPYRLSPSQDHYGYYNGTFNETIFPNNPASKPFHIDGLYRQTLAGGTILGAGINFAPKISGGGNRDAHPEAVKAGSLKMITYPTGGTTTFTFEEHPQDLYFPKIGGLRVQKIENNAGSGPPMVKRYIYHHYQFADKCPYTQNQYYTWFTDRDIRDGYTTTSEAEKNMGFGVPASLAYSAAFVVRGRASSQLALGTGFNFAYTHVTETMEGNGRTEYNYNYIADGESDMGDAPSSEYSYFPGLYTGAILNYLSGPSLFPRVTPTNMTSCEAPYPNFFNNDWRRGHLLSKRVYSEENVLLEEDKIDYEFKPIKGVEGYSFINWTGHYIYARYYNVGGFAKPIKETKDVYSASGMLRTVKDIEYASTFHKQVTETRQTTSAGKVVKTKFYYPGEYGTTFSTLKDKNIIVPIDTRTYKDNRLVAGMQIEYNTLGQPTKVRKAENVATDIPFNNLSPYTFPEESNLTYNTSHLLESVKDKTGVATNYLWSYNNTYPVAEVVNGKTGELFYDHLEEGAGWDANLTAYDNAISHTGKRSGRIDKLTAGEQYCHSTKWLNVSLTQPTKFRFSGWFYSDGPSYDIFLFMKTATETGYFSIVDVAVGTTTGKWTYIEKEYTVPANITQLNIRVDNNGGGKVWFDDIRLHPSNALMTTYTYDPLIGMTSKADANSRPAYFEYDGFNRLLRVRDQEKDILKQYDYQYQAVTHGNAIWQTTGATRCKPCPANASYLTNMLQNEERDNNPNSTTYNQTRWTDTGNPGSCTVSNGWTNTATPVRCRQVGGYNTGEQEQEQRDMNPCSATYNQLRWQVVGTSSSCPVPTYAKITLENEFGGLTRYANVRVSFYQDAACTIPKNVSNLTVKWGVNQYMYNGNEYYYYDYSTSGISGTSYVLGFNLITYEEGWDHPMYGYYSNYYYYVLLSDPAYVITY